MSIDLHLIIVGVTLILLGALHALFPGAFTGTRSSPACRC